MRRRFLVSVAAVDLTTLALGTMVASLLVFGHLVPWVGAGVRIVPLLIVLLGGALTMSVVTVRASGHGVPRPTFGRLLLIVVGTFMIFALALVILREENLYFSRAHLGITFIVWIVLSGLHRLLRQRRPWTENLAVISSEKILADDLAESDHVEVVRVVDPAEEGDIAPLPRGTTIAYDMRSVVSRKVAQFVTSSDIAGYTVRPLTAVYEEHLGRIPVLHLSEGWEIANPVARHEVWLPPKRFIETLMVVVTAPLWLLVGAVACLLVLVSDGRPVFFNQERVGKEGRVFTMTKLRTMRRDAEVDGARFAVSRDDRLIRFGTFLRRSRIDEIPQLVHVVTGEMSLVGPRAEQVPFVKKFSDTIPFYDLRHLIRPGITGWSQVMFGYADGEVDTMEKLTYDLYYLKHMSPVLDLRILWLSIWTVLTGSGAR
ncbi:MAG: hypothetical protein GEU79_15885 [Acidimicrobiia bacterium]|nr:hypothetical protein [Acidimicrobiia bacterium]